MFRRSYQESICLFKKPTILSMEYERKPVTIIWQLENLENICQEKMKLYSPVFSIDVLDGTKWRIGVHRIEPPSISLSLKRKSDSEYPEEVLLYFQFYIRVFHESPSTKKSLILSQTFHRLNMDRKIAMKHPQLACTDSMVIQCKFWNEKGSILNDARFFARTRLVTKKHVFFESFSDLSCGTKTSKTIISSSNENLCRVNLYVYTHGPCVLNPWMDVRIISLCHETNRCYSFRIFELDSLGNKEEIELFRKLPRREGLLDLEFRYKLRENMKNNNGILSVQGELTVWSGIEYEKVETVAFEDYFVYEPKLTDFSTTIEILSSKKGIPGDTKLQTATETFPVHIEVLSAQSAVFEAMFRSDMKEAIQKYVRIDDVGVETMKRMLLFLYSDILEEMEWKDAMNLYIAADKYQILALKQKCGDFLKENLDLSNCNVLLLLADTHQDEDLGQSVKDMMDKNSPDVFLCDQWRSLERNLPHVAIQTFRDLFLFVLG